MELEPMSSPITAFCFPFPNMVAASLDSRGGLARLLELRLAHHPLHPAIQNGLLQLPAVPQFERGHLPFGNVAIEGVGRDAQILGGLTKAHDLARLNHWQRCPSPQSESTPFPLVTGTLSSSPRGYPCSRLWHSAIGVSRKAKP